MGSTELANGIRSEGDSVECSLTLQIALQLLHMSRVISNKNVHLKTKQQQQKTQNIPESSLEYKADIGF